MELMLACSVDESRAGGEEEITEIARRMNTNTAGSSDCRERESHTQEGESKMWCCAVTSDS